jgi:hypothetical protein
LIGLGTVEPAAAASVWSAGAPAAAQRRHGHVDTPFAAHPTATAGTASASSATATSFNAVTPTTNTAATAATATATAAFGNYRTCPTRRRH